MTRAELLANIIRQARKNGFEFRRWYSTRMHLPWTGFETAVQTLLEHRRYYALLFSHDFAQSLWKPGSEITFVVPESFFRRRSSKDGSMIEVRRKPYTRRAGRRDVWKYHLQQLALAEEPLRYMRRYVVTAEHLSPEALARQDEEEMAESAESVMNGNEPETLALAAAAESVGDAEPVPAKTGKKKKRLAL